MDEATGPGGRRLLQPAGGSHFNAAGSGNWNTRLAAPTRGPEIEGHATAAPSGLSQSNHYQLLCF